MQKKIVDLNAQVQQARVLFDEGRVVPSQLVRDEVLRSWLRCRQHGVSPKDQVFLEAARFEQISHVRNQHHRLMTFAEPEMHRLFRAISSAGWVLACVEREGRSIKYFGNDSPCYELLGAALNPGMDLSEDIAGTNAPGCALIEGRPSLVCGSEHFLHSLRDLSCVAVPIFDPAGTLVGALNASKPYDGRPVGILEAVALATRSVENRMVDDLRGALVLALHYRPELTQSPMRGLIHFGEDGEVLGANPSARQMLDIDSLEKMQSHVCFKDLFSCRAAEIEGSQQSPLEVECHNGARLFLKVESLRKGPLSVNSMPQQRRPDIVQSFYVGEPTKPLFDKAHRAFQFGVPVLVTGETGTGKEVLARSLHANGPSSKGAFVAVNCSAIPAGLIESELFGYADGAFTGARRGGARGKFEEANGGTLFLDEIGDMPLEFQARLLRVLQERTVTRLGEEKPRPVSFSLVCATHRNLDELMESGDFRSDLYYRINGLRVQLPALREREDLDALIDHLLASISQEDSPSILTSEARNLLRRHSWRGNIRELQQALNLGQALSTQGIIDVEHLPEDIKAQNDTADVDVGEGGTLAAAERETVRCVLEKHNHNVSAAARELGITRATLYRKIKHFGL
ncbi:sigma-54-dependent Fis family transcriptional regulator [Marinobacter nauticus]|uniref:sigma-54-dependent Fis family transcriptional regulator n=1 Tax=Marinobacter nauticus TaxID=2743 RepID=UPI001C9982E7|nr:sigma-54-dependent Fis family transcriptional regulator [Marinobacter nauticus]MBY5963678.1 sigma-54-dependent Fis family transcriptional regulator [Marinobacter nauticus]